MCSISMHELLSNKVQFKPACLIFLGLSQLYVAFHTVRVYACYTLLVSTPGFLGLTVCLDDVMYFIHYHKGGNGLTL